MPNQEIKCNVESCRYNDKMRFCTLSDIIVGSSGSEAHHKHDTECVSFESE